MLSQLTSTKYNMSLPTSEDVYNRIRTDPRFLTHLATVHHWDSVRNRMLETSLSSFRPIGKGGEVPWHRIYRFAYRDKIVWDRETKMSILDQVALDEANVQLVPLAFSFRMLSWNVLHDALYPSSLSDRRKSERASEIVSHLHKFNADVVCLQEVSISLYNYLVQYSGYAFQAHTPDLDEQIVILSRGTILQSTIVDFPQTHKKQALAVRIATDSGALDIVGVHLTSNARPQAKQKRFEQFQAIDAYVRDHKLRDVMIMGDFNCTDIDFSDADHFVNAAGDVTYASFDPTCNELAEKTSTNKLRQPYDKILRYRSTTPPAVQFVSDSFRLHDDCVCSDHFAISTQCVCAEDRIDMQHQLSAAQEDIRPDPTTALVLICPLAMWPDINFARERCQDDSLNKWIMPHITLAHGFLPVDRLDIWEQLAVAWSARIPAFPVSFQSVDVFQHDKQQTHYMLPDTTSCDALQACYQVGRELCPDVFDRSEYRPHLTLGKREPSRDTVNELIRLVSWTCIELCMLHKPAGHDSYRIIRRVPLKEVSSSKKRSLPQPVSLASLLSRIVCCGPNDAQLRFELGGSSVFECHDVSDIDLVAQGSATIDPDMFFRALTKVLNGASEFVHTSLVSSLHGAFVKTHWHPALLPIDIHLASGASSMGHAVLMEPRTILTRVASTEAARKEFFECLRLVRKKARKCMVYGSAHGFVPGIGWAIIVAAALRHSRQLGCNSSSECINIFDSIARLDWTQPIALHQESINPQAGTPADKLMMVRTTCAPYGNVLRTLTPSTKRILLHAITHRLEPANDDQAYEHRSHMTAVCDDPSNYAHQLVQCEAYLRELLPKLVIRLDHETNANIRPYPIQVVAGRQVSWSVAFSINTNIVDHYVAKMMRKLQNMCPGLTFRM